MSNNTTKPNTSKKKPKRADNKKRKKITYRAIALPGGRSLKMTFPRWTILITLILILVISLVTYPQRSIKSHIKALESQEEIVTYCTEKNLNCTFTVLTDYDVEGYKVSRVSFLDDDFFTRGTTPASETEVVESDVASGSEPVEKENNNHKKNVYITVQQGISIDVPE
ncbi:hypothetical protein RZE82_08305 [Mollicutes bacterium LVI A0039]|nr:hypothetical protein RZE82_08305 [Mollicutes bacterium LVI A0039]